jgi:hypothetical protein
LDILPNSLKWCWRRLVVEKLTFNSLTRCHNNSSTPLVVPFSLAEWVSGPMKHQEQAICPISP